MYFYNQDGNYTESVYIYTQIMYGMLSPWNPDTQNISVSTNSVAESGEEVYVYCYDKDGNYAGAVCINFYTEIQYNLGWYKNYTPFHVTIPVPDEGQRIWTITYNCVTLIVVIHCNGVEVLNMVLSDSVCTKHSWTTYWEQSNGYVYFYNQDGNYTESVYIYTQEP